MTAIPVGADPHEIVTTSDGSIAYISNPQLLEKGHEIYVIDLKELRIDHTIDTAPFFTPHGLALHNGKLFVTAQGSKSVFVLDTASEKVTEVLGTGREFTHLIYVTKDDSKFFTTNVESGTVSVFEFGEIPPYMPPTGVLPPNAKPRQQWTQTLVGVGFGAEGFDVSPDEKELWTACPDGTVVIVDLSAKKVEQTIETGVKGLHRLKMTADGKTVCIVSVKTGELLFFDRITRKLEKTMRIGRGAGIFIDGNRMFVSCTPDNYVSVIDLETRKEVSRIEVARPDGMTSVIVK